MILIVFSSVVVLAICIERLYTLNPRKIAPPHLLATVWKQLKRGELDAALFIGPVIAHMGQLTQALQLVQHHIGAILAIS